MTQIQDRAKFIEELAEYAVDSMEVGELIQIAIDLLATDYEDLSDDELLKEAKDIGMDDDDNSEAIRKVKGFK